MNAMRDILRTPYVVGGRRIGEALDCLGVVREIAIRRGLPGPDGWPDLVRAWSEGQRDYSGFPPGWARVDDAEPLAIQDGDVLLFTGTEPSCAIVHEGYVYSSSRAHGAYAVPVFRWRVQPAEVWRFQGP